MTRKKAAVTAFAALFALGACGRADTTADTTTIVDTVPGMATPRTDTLVRTDTVRTDTLRDTAGKRP